VENHLKLFHERLLVLLLLDLDRLLDRDSDFAEEGDLSLEERRLSRDLDLDLDLVLDLDLDLDLDLLPPPSSTSRILRPSSSSPSSLSKAYSMSLLLPNSTMPSPTLGWLVLV
jgi:hypothetical protein